mgnify:CR=1 FL=1
MRTPTLLFAWAAGVLLAGPPPEVRDVPDSSENVFALVLTFEQDFSPPTLEQMQREVEYILRPFGFQFQWRMGRNDRQDQIANLLVSVRLRGKCAALEYRELVDYSHSRTLGTTEVSEGQLLSYCAIDCDHVRQMIRPAVGDESFTQTQFLLGRALARVLTHELYHILAGTIKHCRRGVSKAVVTPEDLVEGVWQLEPEEVEAIRQKTLLPGMRPKPRPQAAGDGGR